jgi:Tfp pilus assembly protein FimT
VEILVVVAVLGILATLAVSSFLGISEKYKVESETKQLYADLMDVRGRAMQRSRFYHVQFTANGYATSVDGFPAPDGDSDSTNGANPPVVNATVNHAITTAFTGGATSFSFNRNGIPSVTGHLWLASSANPDYDCITIAPTRIKMGKYNAATFICAEK